MAPATIDRLVDRSARLRTARHAACMLRASIAPGCAVPKIQARQTAYASSGRLAAWLRSTPHPPFPPALRHGALRPKQRGQGLAAPSGLRLSDSSAAGCCATGSVAPFDVVSLRCRFPARVCPRLRSPSGAPCPAMFGGRPFNIMQGIMRTTPLRSVLSGSRPHNLHYV